MKPTVAILASALALASGTAVAQPPPPGPPPAVVLTFENDLPSTYQLKRVRLLVDGTLRFDGTTGFQMWLSPGAHNVDILADYRFNDPVFTYMRDYAVELHGVQATPAAAPGHTVQVLARALPRGDALTPADKRAAITFQTTTR